MDRAVTSKFFVLYCSYFVSDRTQVQESDDVTKTVPCPHKVLYDFQIGVIIVIR